MQQNILIVHTGNLREFIAALGAMAFIRRQHASDKISFLTTAKFADMAQECGYFDEILIDDQPRFYDIFGMLQLRSVLKAAQFSVLYDVQHGLRSFFYSVLAGVQAKPLPVLSQNSQCDLLDWLKRDISGFGLNTPFVLIFPNPSGPHLTQTWPIESFRCVICKLILNGYVPVLIGAKDDQKTIERLMRGLHGIVNLTHKMVWADIPSLAKTAVAVIGYDTDEMYMAMVAGCPAIMVCQEDSKMQALPIGCRGELLVSRNLRDISAQSVWAKVQMILQQRSFSENKADSDSQSYRQHAGG